MKKLILTKLLCFVVLSCALAKLPKNPKTNYKTISFESNFLAHHLGIKYDNLNVNINNNCISYSIGLSSIYKRANYIVPPNIGVPIEVLFLRKKHFNYLQMGLAVTPQFVFSKGYTHYDKEDLILTLTENTTLMYLIPSIGYRFQEVNGFKFEAKVGPRIKVLETNSNYIGEIFENNKLLETLYFKLSFGFTI